MSLAAWRAMQGRCAPSHQARRHTPAPGRAAGGPRRNFCRRLRRRCYGSNMRRWWRARREAIGLRLELVEDTPSQGTKPPRSTSAELLFSCCGKVAALPALANHNELRGAVSNGPGITTKYMRRTTSGTAGYGPGATDK
jgi:hypothetical protein